MLAEDDFETPEDATLALKLVSTAIARISAGRAGQVQRIGVTVPAPTDADRRKMLYAPRLGWRF